MTPAERQDQINTGRMKKREGVNVIKWGIRLFFAGVVQQLKGVFL